MKGLEKLIYLLSRWLDFHHTAIDAPLEQSQESTMIWCCCTDFQGKKPS